MSFRRIQKDDIGIFLRAGGYLFRPGGVTGCDHVYDMGYGGLREGDRVRACHMSGTEMAHIRFGDDFSSSIVWSSLDMQDMRRTDQSKFDPNDGDAASECDATSRFQL